MIKSIVNVYNHKLSQKIIKKIANEIWYANELKISNQEFIDWLGFVEGEVK